MFEPECSSYCQVEWNTGGRSVVDDRYLTISMPAGEELKIGTVVKIGIREDGDWLTATVLAMARERHELLEPPRQKEAPAPVTEPAQRHEPRLLSPSASELQLSGVSTPKEPDEEKIIRSIEATFRVVFHTLACLKPRSPPWDPGTVVIPAPDEDDSNTDDFSKNNKTQQQSNKTTQQQQNNINNQQSRRSNNEDREWVPIGSGLTLVHKEKYRKVNWKSYTAATRTLLTALFSRKTLATHSLTGKKSPAFADKPAKMCLDPKIVSDIVLEITDRFQVKSNLVRSIITTKCADECKMQRMRLAKKNHYQR